MKRILIALVVVCSACGGATPAPPAPAAAPASSSGGAAALKAPGEAKVGDRTRCPVSGEEFVVKDDSPRADVGGKTYYFCCPHCSEKFKADPSKFLGSPGI